MNVPAFLKEAWVMKNFRHDHVMGLLAVCMDQEETPLVVLPYMEHGDLLSYLHDDNHVIQSSPPIRNQIIKNPMSSLQAHFTVILSFLIIVLL